MARPIANPITYGTIVTSPTPLSNLDTSFGAIFTTGFNDSSLGWVNYAADTGAVNAYAVTLGVAPSSYTAGMCVAFTPQNTNTGSSTINVNALGAKAIVTPSGNGLNGGEISINQLCILIYDGTSFRISGGCSLGVTVTGTSSGLSVNCAGYTSIFVYVTYSATGLNTALNNVSIGVPIQIIVGNTTGGAGSYSLSMSNAAGTNVNPIFAIQGGVNGGVAGVNIASGSGSISINANSNIVFTGSLQSATQALFVR